MAEVLMALFEREQARRDLYSDCLQAAIWLLVFAMMLIRWGMM